METPDSTPYGADDEPDQDEVERDGPILSVTQGPDGTSTQIRAVANAYPAAQWGIVLADVVRLLACTGTRTDRESAERLIAMRDMMIAELRNPTETLEIKHA